MIEICKIKILNAIGKHLFDDPIYIVIREIQSSMLQRYFRFGLNRTTSVRKSFVFLTARDAKERNYMKRNRPPRRRIGPNGQLESEGASQDKQRVRLTAILTGLQQTGRVSVETLSKQLGVSVVTVRRDLDALDEKGLLRRTHGGAVSIEPLFYEQFRRDQSFLAQEKHASDEKRRIGRAEIGTKRVCCGARMVERYPSSHCFTSNSGATNHFWRRRSMLLTKSAASGELLPRSSTLEKRLH